MSTGSTESNKLLHACLVVSVNLQDLTKGSDIASFRLPVGRLRHRRGRRRIAGTAGDAADGYACDGGAAY